MSRTRRTLVVFDSSTEGFLDGWQGRFTFGAAIERWMDASYVGWEGQFTSPMHCERDDVDRVVFNVFGAEPSYGASGDPGGRGRRGRDCGPRTSGRDVRAVRGFSRPSDGGRCEGCAGEIAGALRPVMSSPFFSLDLPLRGLALRDRAPDRQAKENEGDPHHDSAHHGAED